MNSLTNFSEKLNQKNYDSCISFMVDFQEYLIKKSPALRKKLDDELRLLYTFECSTIISKMIFSIAWCMAYKAFVNNEIDKDKLKDYANIELPADFEIAIRSMDKFRTGANTIYNNILAHIKSQGL